MPLFEPGSVNWCRSLPGIGLVGENVGVKALIENRTALATLLGAALIVVVVGLVSDSTAAVAWTGGIVGVVAGVIIAGKIGGPRE